MGGHPLFTDSHPPSAEKLRTGCGSPPNLTSERQKESAMKKNYRNRGEAAVLTIALAVAGTLSLLNELLAVWGHGLSWAALLHSAPYLVVAVAISLIMAEEQAVVSSSTSRQKEGKYGR
jgi:gamma-glutamyltranspeptidase